MLLSQRCPLATSRNTYRKPSPSDALTYSPDSRHLTYNLPASQLAAATSPARGHRSALTARTSAAAAAAVVQNTDGVLAVQGNDSGLSTAASSILTFALNLAQTSKTYEVHSWMILLGILKQERCAAAAVLKVGVGAEQIGGLPCCCPLADQGWVQG